MTAPLRVENGDVELLVTLDMGPRVVRYARPGGPNPLLDLGPAGGGPGFRLRGGHRLWIAPEDPVRTYVPDNDPVEHEVRERGVRATTPADPRFGLEKTIDITLDARGTGARLVHRVKNRGRDPQTLAAWCLTVLAPGGTALVPLPPRGTHPEDRARSAADFAPRGALVLWPYFRFGDPRLRLSERWIRMRGDPEGDGPLKFGLLHREGWAGYWRDGQLFVKRFGVVEGATYPDGGVNFESYTDRRFLELETLSPLVTLHPGEEVVHEERWELHPMPMPPEDVPPERLMPSGG